MSPLTLDDLLPLEEYAARRVEFFESHRRFLDRYRRVRIGPSIALIFENRQTLWFKVHEILRVARLADPARVQRELDWYNGLLPGRNRLHAAMVIDDQLQTNCDSAIELKFGDLSIAATVTTCRPEDRCVGTAFWLEFTLGRAERKALEAGPAWCEAQHGDHRYTSAALNSSQRQSLLDDLALSDRDAA